MVVAYKGIWKGGCPCLVCLIFGVLIGLGMTQSLCLSSPASSESCVLCLEIIKIMCLSNEKLHEGRGQWSLSSPRPAVLYMHKYLSFD